MPAQDDAPVARPSSATPLAPAEPVAEPAVTGRANDEPESNSTFGTRAKAVDSGTAENKSVEPKKSARKNK